jgi:S-disulfanyl-L-cysteine oxidoreductase SoxD
MTKSYVARLVVSGAAVAGMGAVLVVSGMSFAAERRALPLPVQHAETRILVAQAEAAATPATTPATYTAAQAEDGKKEFGHECVECHGKDLRGGLLGGPPLRGVSFLEKYGKGSPAGALFDVMSQTMPPNAPGSYSPKTNGVAAGAELPSDVDALYNLTIDK